MFICRPWMEVPMQGSPNSGEYDGLCYACSDLTCSLWLKYHSSVFESRALLEFVPGNSSFSRRPRRLAARMFVPFCILFPETFGQRELLKDIKRVRQAHDFQWPFGLLAPGRASILVSAERLIHQAKHGVFFSFFDTVAQTTYQCKHTGQIARPAGVRIYKHRIRSQSCQNSAKQAKEVTTTTTWHTYKLAVRSAQRQTSPNCVPNGDICEHLQQTAKE